MVVRRCEDTPYATFCCSSCHEDWEMDCGHYPEDVTVEGVEYAVCHEVADLLTGRPSL